MKIGSVIVVEGFRARDGSNNASGGTVTFADGQLYCFGQGKGTLVRILATPEGWKETGRMDLPRKSQMVMVPGVALTLNERYDRLPTESGVVMVMPG